MLLSAIVSGRAEAAARTFVASDGLDANTAFNCSLAKPCRGFSAAQTVTDNSGEIIVLDSAGYGAVTITKSISIIAPSGVYAGIAVFPGLDGVSIATPGISVVLRGLTINGQGGDQGINMIDGAKLTVENCLISNLNQNGIVVTAPAIVRVTDTTIRDNGFDGIRLQSGARGTVTRTMIRGHNIGYGIYVASDVPGSITTGDIANTTIDGNANGIFASSLNATAVVKVSLRDGRIVGNSGLGVVADSSAGAAVTISASNNIVSNNGIGISAFSTGTKLWASGNTVSDNTAAGWLNQGALFESAGNNAVRNNLLDISGAITPIATQ